ncbi:MAG: hypothetical protein ACT4O2_10410 [Beijerinckiaceae bacterium]
MAIDIDGIAVLHAIAGNPLVFPDVAPELSRVARTLVVKQLKAKATTLEGLRHIHGAIGGEAFVLILDDLGDSGSASLVKKLDKENLELKTALPAWNRKRLADLASGAASLAEKASKPAPARRAVKPGQSPEQKALASSLKAVKTRELGKVRDLWREHGATSFALVLGGLTEKQTQGLAKKLDKDNPDIARSSVEALRQRIADLASGVAEPESILESKAMAASAARLTNKRA